LLIIYFTTTKILVFKNLNLEKDSKKIKSGKKNILLMILDYFGIEILFFFM
jgi:hypothetical protein